MPGELAHRELKGYEPAARRVGEWGTRLRGGNVYAGGSTGALRRATTFDGATGSGTTVFGAVWCLHATPNAEVRPV